MPLFKDANNPKWSISLYIVSVIAPFAAFGNMLHAIHADNNILVATWSIAFACFVINAIANSVSLYKLLASAQVSNAVE